MSKKEQKTKKILQGVVIKITDESTIKVEVERKAAHPLYKKIIKSHKRYLVHNDSNLKPKVGDRVTIEEMRPVSKSKRFKLIKVQK